MQDFVTEQCNIARRKANIAVRNILLMFLTMSRYFSFPARKLKAEVKILKKEKEPKVYRLDPSIRLCPNFDYASMALFPIAEPGQMGMRVQDNCAEEHIM